MVLIKLDLPKPEHIISRNKFVVDKILPVAIKRTPSKDKFVCLFVCYQNYDESFLYLNYMIKIENGIEENMILTNELYIDNISKNPKKIEMYKEFISNMKENNQYSTDFIMNKSLDYSNYYQNIAIRPIDKTHATIMDLYFTRDNFIKTSIFISTIFNSTNPQFVFNDEKMNNIEYVKIEQIKYDATTQITGENENKLYNCSHYTANCGPTEFRFNNITSIGKEYKSKSLSNYLDLNIYLATYKNDYIIEFVLLNEFDEYLIIYISDKKTYALVFSKDLLEKTNIIDKYNKIYL